MRNMTVRLDDKQAWLLDAVAQIDDKSAAQVIREAIEQHIAKRFQDAGFQERLRQSVEESKRLLEELGKD